MKIVGYINSGKFGMTLPLVYTLMFYMPARKLAVV